MAEINWLVGQGNAGTERICPGRHILQTEWQFDWNNVFSEHKYVYISDYECIIPHPIDQGTLSEDDRRRWRNLQAAKMRGCGIPIQIMAHFTNEVNARKIVDSFGFTGGPKKINENENGDPELERFSWWSPIFQVDNVDMVRQHLKELLTPFCLQDVDDIDCISTQFASSDAFFPKSWRYGKVYFQCSLEELCNFYTAYIHSDDLQFRVLRTFLYKQEIMHAILVCAAVNGHDLFPDYPEIPVQGNTEEGDDTENANRRNIVMRDSNGNWKWYPQATGAQIGRLNRYYQNYVRFRRWEHVAFAFHMPQDDIMFVNNLVKRQHVL